MDDPATFPPLPRRLDAAAILDKLVYAVGKDPEHATLHDWYLATALAVRDPLIHAWMASTRRIYRERRRRVYYLSIEFLLGRMLPETVHNLGLGEDLRTALAGLGLEPEALFALEPDAALGNGGLGRLAACFLESMASCDVAGFGYGLLYRHGLFEQRIEDGFQVEEPEEWLAFPHPLLFARPEVAYPVGFGGSVEDGRDARGRPVRRWRPQRRVFAVAHDLPVAGMGGRAVSTLRLWQAKSGERLDLRAFNRGDYLQAVEDQVLAESLTRVLYPDDADEPGRRLRLQQEYFFVSASMQDLLRRHLSVHEDLSALPEAVAIQLNDTHPALAIPELVRLLVDEHGLDFDEAFPLVRDCFAYTNHTLMPEALERWPLRLLEELLPRHLEIVFEMNARILGELRARPGNPDPFLTDVSMIEETGARSLRMGHLAFLGSRRTNGVSRLHGELLERTVFAPLCRHFPERLLAVTNGVAPRRWLAVAHPHLARLVDEAIGPDWRTDLERLAKLEPLALDAAFRERFAAARRLAKERLADRIAADTGIEVDPAALFDVHVKRIHEYKRQLLNLLECVALYLELRDGPRREVVPQVRILAGKAASAYRQAKLIVKLANDIASVVNGDPAVGGRLKLVFLPNYNVSLAERIMPAADLSEQISTAGTEASGTGNMKMALLGALTLCTRDGANLELAEHIGPENLFAFGLDIAGVARLWREGRDPAATIAADPRLAAALDAIAGGLFSPDDPDRFRPLVDELRTTDRWLVTADFADYRRARREAEALWCRPDAWWQRAVLSTARSGWFSADRAIREYAERIWNVPVAVPAAVAPRPQAPAGG